MIWNSKFHVFGVEIGEYRDNFSEIVLVQPQDAPKQKKCHLWTKASILGSYLCICKKSGMKIKHLIRKISLSTS